MYKLLICFISGLTITFISFNILPFAFLLTGVYVSTIFILLGIIFTNLTEYKFKSNNINLYKLHFKFSLLVILFSFFSYVNGILLSFCGGSLLYSASYCVDPCPCKNFKYKITNRLVAILGALVGILISM